MSFKTKFDGFIAQTQSDVVVGGEGFCVGGGDHICLLDSCYYVSSSLFYEIEIDNFLFCLLDQGDLGEGGETFTTKCKELDKDMESKNTDS